jgi:hypothetical protein
MLYEYKLLWLWTDPVEKSAIIEHVCDLRLELELGETVRRGKGRGAKNLHLPRPLRDWARDDASAAADLLLGPRFIIMSCVIVD